MYNENSRGKKAKRIFEKFMDKLSKFGAKH